MISFELHDEAFMDWIETVRSSFTRMTETMINVAENLKDRVQFMTPIETGKLSRSFRWHILTDNSRMKVFEVEMTALNERTGFDYAFVQHRGWHISKTGRMVLYGHSGTTLGFTNYRSSYLNDGGFEENTNYDNWTMSYDGSHYLERAIIRERDSAFELIETDYLSLFGLGGIF